MSTDTIAQHQDSVTDEDDLPQLVESDDEESDEESDEDDAIDEDKLPDLLPDESDDEEELSTILSDEESNDEVDESDQKEDPEELGRGKRKRVPRNTARQYCYHIGVKPGLRQYGRDALKAIKDELKQMLVDKKALSPVRKCDLSARQLKKAIRSFMFLKTKFDGLGRFERIKARLVANGKQQDREMYPDVYSPTVQLVSVLMCLVIAASENRKVAVADIGGAYLNAERTSKAGEEIIMELEPMLVSILKKIAPEVIPFVDESSGKLYVKLDKALYGTLDAAKLWYEKLSGVLKSKGFVQNETDPCVFNKMFDGKQCTILLYVDDLLLLCVTDQVITSVINMLKAEFGGDVKFSMDQDLSYLGMHLHIGKGSIVVSMESYVESLLRDCGVVSGVSSPATGKLFKVNADSTLLGIKEAKWFHTVVARLLYLAKRTRVDILLAVAFLTTRVKAPTDDDQGKLMRVLKYLYSTKSQVLVLAPTGELKVEGYIDAAFGCHEDGKSHTGVVITLAGMMVASMSSKQKIVSKDSTEAELAGLSDKVLSVVQCYEFLCGQGYDNGPPTVYQDNTSCIHLVTQDGGSFRTKYFKVRRARIREMCDAGEILLVYLETRRMLADILTKPLQGGLFLFLLQCIIGGMQLQHRGA